MAAPEPTGQELYQSAAIEAHISRKLDIRRMLHEQRSPVTDELHQKIFQYLLIKAFVGGPGGPVDPGVMRVSVVKAINRMAKFNRRRIDLAEFSMRDPAVVELCQDLHRQPTFDEIHDTIPDTRDGRIKMNLAHIGLPDMELLYSRWRWSRGFANGKMIVLALQFVDQDLIDRRNSFVVRCMLLLALVLCCWWVYTV